MSDGGRLSGLDNKTVAGNVYYYSRFVKFIKILFPLGVIAIIGILLIYPQIAHIDTAPLTQDDLKALKQAETENNLKNPVYNTLDSKGNPFSITAAMARQSRDNSDLVLLNEPSAQLREGDMTYNMQAGSGEYDQAKKILVLNDQVAISDTNDITLKTNTLVSLIDQGTAYSESKAILSSKDGTIEGQSVHIDHYNQITTFKGPAKAIIIKNQE